MPASLSAAVDLLVAGRHVEAEAALRPHVGTSRTGVIARFRHAECLSRLGRHDEACAEAARAAADTSDTPAAPLWLAWTLAEAGRFDEAGEVALPRTSVEPLDFLRDGFRALARMARDDRRSPEDDARLVLDSRHAPLYSLALRRAEAWRLGQAVRGPDLPTVWYRIECGQEMAYDGLKTHPAAPAAPAGGETARQAARWLRMHAACGDFDDLVRAIRVAKPVPADTDEAEFEMLLALGRLDAADVLATRLREELAKDGDAAGEFATCCARLAQLRGEPARVEAFPGHADARQRLAQMAAWLDLGAALIESDDLAARAAADLVADPSRREFVEAALQRWVLG